MKVSGGRSYINTVTVCVVVATVNGGPIISFMNSSEKPVVVVYEVGAMDIMTEVLELDSTSTEIVVDEIVVVVVVVRVIVA